MRLCQFDNPYEFYAWAQDYLLQDEATHNLLLRLCQTLMRDRDHFSNAYMAIVESEGTLAAVAIKTPRHPLVLSKVTDHNALALIAQSLYTSQQSLAAVSGPANESHSFAQIWQTQTGKPYRLSMTLQVHQLDTVQLQPRSPGALRCATEDDRALLLQWHDQFLLEALGQTPGDAELWLNHHLQHGTAYLWQASTPVSLACYGSTSSTSIAVNMVYTPPQERKKGYASSCVAALCQLLLTQGKRHCFLFTDLANETSNKIYRAIGFQPVADWTNYNFKD